MTRRWRPFWGLSVTVHVTATQLPGWMRRRLSSRNFRKRFARTRIRDYSRTSHGPPGRKSRITGHNTADRAAPEQPSWAEAGTDRVGGGVPPAGSTLFAGAGG